MKKQETISTKAPMRFDFAGGYTDVSPFKEMEGGNVVNMAIEKFASVSIQKRDDSIVTVNSKDMDTFEVFCLDDEITLDGPMRLIKASISYLLPNFGFDLTTHVDAPVGSGLGASASLAVALLGALRIFREENVDSITLAKDALYVENELLSNINGGQDQYAATLGGVNFFSFDDENVSVDQIGIDPKIISSIEKRSLLVHSGESRISGNVLDEVMLDYRTGKASAVDGLRTLKSSSFTLTDALVSGDLQTFAELLRDVYVAQKGLHMRIETPTIRKIFKIANEVGLLAGKIAGAGGGGGVYLYSDEKSIELIRGRLIKAGFLTSPFKINLSGFQHNKS